MTRSQSLPGQTPPGRRATSAAVRRENYRMASLHRPGRTLDGTLALADEALYRGKQAGRNCVMSPPVEPLSERPFAGEIV